MAVATNDKNIINHQQKFANYLQGETYTMHNKRRPILSSFDTPFDPSRVGAYLFSVDKVCRDWHFPNYWRVKCISKRTRPSDR